MHLAVGSAIRAIHIAELRGGDHSVVQSGVEDALHALILALDLSLL